MTLCSPLSDRTYRHLFAAQVIALAGTGLTTIALSLLAYDIAGGSAGAILGTVLALKMVAYVTIAPVVGAWAHRIPRRAFLVGLDLGRALVVLALPFVSEIWQIYALVFLLNALSAGFTPVFQATIPDVLPDEATYTRALSLSRLAFDLENLLSPTLAALALALVSYDALFVANGAAFAMSAALVLSVRLPSPSAPERPPGVWSNVTHGIGVYLLTPRLRGLLALSLAVAAAGAMVIVNTVVYVRDVLGMTATDMAIMFASAGAGSMVVALLVPRLLERMADRTLMLCGSGFLVAGLVAGSFMPSFGPGLGVWFVLGAGSAMVQTPAGRLLRRSAHAPDRPAVFAAQFALSHLCWLVTYPLAGVVGASAGLPAAFVVLAGVVVVATLAAARLWPAGDPSVVEHEHPDVRHAHQHVHDEHHQHDHEGWEGPEPHRHPHRHAGLRHRHAFIVDLHHRQWPERS